MDAWRKAWLDNSRGCPSPDTLMLPVGAGVRTTRDGIEIAGRLWTPQIGYVTPENVDVVRDASRHLTDKGGFEIVTGSTYVRKTPRVDGVWTGSHKPATRMYAEGMVEIYATIKDARQALIALKANPMMTVCPVCTDYARYTTDDSYREIINACSRYFLRYWYYGAI